MKFENKGKWFQESEDTLKTFDTQEHPDFLDGDDKVLTMEDGDDEELMNFEEDELDIVDEDDTLDSPEDEEMDLAMEAMPPKNQRKRIEFEDDIVRVYDGNKEIYAGAEDYEPMQDENWKWDDANKYYKFDKYIKVCCESSQKNEGSYWEYSVDVLDNYGDIKYGAECKTQADIDKAIKHYKSRAVELRDADNCRTIEVVKELVDDDGNILKSKTIKRISLESSQKNEGKVTAQKFKNWSKRNQVKAAIDKADEKTFEKLMNDFCLNVAKGDYFPQTIVKKGKLLFALTDEPITLDSIEKYFVEDEYLFESSQKNEGKFKITDSQGKFFFYKTAEDSGWTNGQSKLYPVKVFNTRQEAEKCIKDEYLGPEVKIVQESSQKNEASLKDDDIQFSIIGGGFEVMLHSLGALTNQYGLFCSGYSSNSNAPGFVNDNIPDDREGYDKLQKERLAIAKEIKPFADKFEKEIENIFAKHGFKKVR